MERCFGVTLVSSSVGYRSLYVAVNFLMRFLKKNDKHQNF